MTKAAVRATDAVQGFLRDKQNRRIENFIIIGGSKRGWATWLTAAVDPRVNAIAPASIKLLNLEQQFTHHWNANDFYAPALEDYAEFDLPCRTQTPAGQRLLQIVDPYQYRNRLTMPKFVANSAGDQFFLPDSSRFYYNELPEPKLLRFTPNTDHGQNIDVILSALSWIDDVLDDKSSPKYSWTVDADGSLRVQVQLDPAALSFGRRQARMRVISGRRTSVQPGAVLSCETSAVGTTWATCRHLGVAGAPLRLS